MDPRLRRRAGARGREGRTDIAAETLLHQRKIVGIAGGDHTG